MFAQSRVASRRAFSTSTISRSGHFKEGLYSNIPFKVHNRKIPYAIVHFGFFGIGFFIPFGAAYFQLKKSGSI